MSKNIKYWIIPGNELNNTLRELSKLFWLPQINKQLSLFSKSSKKELIVRFVNKEWYFKIHTIWEKDADYTHFYTGNIKAFLEYFSQCWFLRCNTKEIIEFQYSTQSWKIIISVDTNIWNVLKIINADKTTISRILSKCNWLKWLFWKWELNKIIDTNWTKTKLKQDEIINKFWVINPIISNYIRDVWLYTSNNNKTLKDKVWSFWNDYSFYEKAFYQITWLDLLWEKEFSWIYMTWWLSIIIPAYESGKIILKTLFSINNQKLSDKNYKNIQVIIVDDASSTPIKSIIWDIKFKFQLLIIRSETNQWRSISRNIWLWVAKFDNIICIDSDIILPNNYIKEMSYRITMIPNAIFMSFRNNIKNSEIKIDQISKWLKRPSKYNDNRLERFVKKWQYSYHKINESCIIQLLSESNYFKNLWYWRCIWLYDLPLAVSSHNICFNKKFVNNKFNEKFCGRGMEDSFFWAEAISKWIFVIPVLSTWVYHIKHKPRSINKAYQKKQLAKNLQLYKDLLESKND